MRLDPVDVDNPLSMSITVISTFTGPFIANTFQFPSHFGSNFLAVGTESQTGSFTLYIQALGRGKIKERERVFAITVDHQFMTFQC